MTVTSGPVGHIVPWCVRSARAGQKEEPPPPPPPLSPAWGRLACGVSGRSAGPSPAYACVGCPSCWEGHLTQDGPHVPCGRLGSGEEQPGRKAGVGAAHIGSCLDLCHKRRLRDLCNDSDSGQMVVWRSISDRTWATCVWPVGSARCRQAGPPGGRASGGGGFPGLDAALGPSRNAPKPTPASQRRLRAQGPPADGPRAERTRPDAAVLGMGSLY